ncbi:MAG: class I SAM-dependent methyltransferase [Candidatus Binatia bacterium]|nr:class I SAM-dependent methyltransferase [Candidatus Binatia bacterium]
MSLRMGQKPTDRQWYRHWLTSRLASHAPERWSPEEYRRFVRRYYDGPAGWFTLLSGILTGHETLAYRIIGPHGFDIRGCRRILDAGCGNGRYLRFLLRAAEPQAVLDGCDLSLGMLRRARQRLQSSRPCLVAAALQHLPYRDHSFDAIVCGWVLEHLPDVSAGLSELRRVLRPGGKLLLLTTEDTLLGALCSRIYASRTTNRRALRALVEACGLRWYRELWWSRVHRRLGLGGIVVEVRNSAASPTALSEQE